MVIRLLTLALLLLVCVPAQAATITGETRWQSVADSGYLPALDGPVEVREGSCEGSPCVLGEPPIIFLPADATRADFWHEMGHLIDWHVLRPRHRRALRRKMKWPAWESQSSTRPAASELFAEFYARCAVRRPCRAPDAGWRRAPTRRQIRWAIWYTSKHIQPS